MLAVIVVGVIWLIYFIIEWIIKAMSATTSTRANSTFAPDTRYIPDHVRQQVLRRDGYRCVQCGSPSYLEIDHIIPLAGALIQL